MNVIAIGSTWQRGRVKPYRRPWWVWLYKKLGR